MFIHVVKPGDSVYAIARKYGVPYSRIISDNGLIDPNKLVVGQALVVMTDEIKHTVMPGETLYTIARSYGVPLSSVINANPNLSYPYTVRPGDTVTVPRAEAKLGEIEVNGYIIPNISTEVLQKTLPYLTYLSIFSYMVKADGSLSSIDDEPAIAEARKMNVAPMMVITNTEEGKGFSSDVARSILRSKQAQDALLANVLAVMKEKNYYGLNIDFEYIYKDDRDNYTAFVRKASEELHALGYSISTSLAPKNRADQAGLLYEAHDYGAHGRLVDHVILMTYEWGYTYGPAMAVAPVDQVAKVLTYAVTVIPPKKILMGMPNYGYDWTLPFVRGTSAETLGNRRAVERAAQVGAEIQFDPVAMAPFYRYYADGQQHEVWFDDARSIRARLLLVNRFGLGGVSYWTVNTFYPQNWLVLSSMYNIKKVLK